MTESVTWRDRASQVLMAIYEDTVFISDAEYPA